MHSLLQKVLNNDINTFKHKLCSQCPISIFKSGKKRKVTARHLRRKFGDFILEFKVLCIRNKCNI